MIRQCLACVLLVLCASCAEEQAESAGSTLDLSPEAAGVHQRILTLDSHLDTPALFHRGVYDFSARGSYEEDRTNVDLPRLQAGDLDGGFWVIYTAPGPLTVEAYREARTTALLRQMSIREMAAKYADSVELAFAADDARRIHDADKEIGRAHV